MCKIGRLGEVLFRQVQQATGNALGIDRFNRYYRYLILWDEEELEIYGSSRIGEAWKILQHKGDQSLYTRILFEFKKSGHLFGKRSLDYLWHGIDVYLYQHQAIQYMFGPVSLSHSYPEAAHKRLLAFILNFWLRQNICSSKVSF